MEGLDYRLKEEGSLSDKILREAKDNGISRTEAASQVKDAVRYTGILPEGDFTSGFEAIRAEMEAKGYSMSDFRNSLKDTDVPYRGINTNFVTSGGYKFEMQFHTRDSFDIKEFFNHDMYKDFQNPATPQSVQRAILAEMKATANRIPTPRGVERLVQ